MLSMPAPFAKSQTLFQFRVMDGLIKYQEQMDMESGSVMDGI
jgi:hypothetical protein